MTKPPRLPLYLTASLIVSLGGLLNGYDTGSIGALASMKQFDKSMGKLSPFYLGFTVSLIQLTGVVPSVFAGYLSDRFGRLKIITFGAILFVIGVAIQGSSQLLVEFLVGRGIAGLGEGIYLSNMQVYICEIAPAKHRGMLAGLPQFMATLGICLGYFTCYFTVHILSSMAWRMPFVLQAGVGFILAASCFTLPDSPRWLVLHGRRVEALEVLQKLNFSVTEAQQDVFIQNDQRLSISFWQGFLLLFRRGYRARSILALFVLGMVQLSGIDGVLYYAPTLFEQAGLPGSTASFLASGLSAILMLLISIPAFLLVDKLSRRTLAISGGLALSACMLLIGTLYAAGAVHPYGIARWIVIISVFIFGLTYCATWGIVGKIYASEIQPTNTRAVANCVAQGLGFFTNWLVAIITPILLSKSAFGAYFLFGGLALGTVAVLAAYMPETRGKSLEAIQESFGRPVVKSWRHFITRKAQASTLRNESLTANSTDNAISLESLETRSAATSGVESGSHIIVPSFA